MQSVEIRKAANAQDVAQQAAIEILSSLKELLTKQSSVHLALTGGSVGIRTLEVLSTEPELQALDWNQVHIWWGDERYVPKSSKDRNANQAAESLLNKLVIPKENIHEFPSSDGGLSVMSAASAFAVELADSFRDRIPAMDLTILGMGPDGHIASLFPGHSHSDSDIVFEADSPKPPSERLSFSSNLLNRSKKIIYVVSGIDKAEAIEQIHTNEDCELPAARVAAKGETIWFIDEAAGAVFWSC